jgi:hypothetical protein
MTKQGYYDNDVKLSPHVKFHISTFHLGICQFPNELYILVFTKTQGSIL